MIVSQKAIDPALAGSLDCVAFGSVVPLTPQPSPEKKDANPLVGGTPACGRPRFIRPDVKPDAVPVKSLGVQAAGGIGKLDASVFIAQVKSSEEKIFAWWLLCHGIEYFLPLDEVVKRSGRTKYVVRRSLFPGYVFLFGDDSTPAAVREMGQPCRVIRVPHPDGLKGELAQIERAVDSDVQVEECPYLVKGQRYRVTEGPLMNCEGVGIRRQNHSGILLEISMLGRAIEAEVPWHMLEPA